LCDFSSAENFCDGKCYLIADRINPGRVFSRVMHEYVVHFGLRKTMGQENFDALMDQIWNDHGQEILDSAWVQAYGYDKEQTAAMWEEYHNLDENDPRAMELRQKISERPEYQGRMLAEEWLARKAEAMAAEMRAGIESAEMTRWRKFLAKFRKFLADHHLLPRSYLNRLDDRTLTDMLCKVGRNAGYQIDADGFGAVEDGGMASIAEFEDGLLFVDVKVDQHLFDGLDRDQAGALAQKIIKDRFSGTVIGKKNFAFVNKTAGNWYRYPSTHIDDDVVYKAKMRASTELDNLLDAGKPKPDKKDGEAGHVHQNVDSFSYFETVFKVGDRFYQGLVNIMNNNIGKLFKDVTKIKDITEAISNSYGKNPKFTYLNDVSNTNINAFGDLSSGDSKKSGRGSVGRGNGYDGYQIDADGVGAVEDGGMAAVDANGNPLFGVMGKDNLMTAEAILKDPSIDIETLLINDKGNINWGQIEPEIAQAGKNFNLKAWPIRLKKGIHRGEHQGFGLAHFYEQHAEKLFGKGYRDLSDFIYKVFYYKGKVYASTDGKKVRLEITPEKGNRIGIIDLMPKDGFYSIVTAFPRDLDYYKIQGKLIWQRPGDGRASIDSSASVTPPSKQRTGYLGRAIAVNDVANNNRNSGSKSDYNINAFGDLSSVDSKKSGRGSVSGLNDDKNLVVVHNVSPQKLRDAAKLGAMPAPSLAVIRDLRNDLEQYGGTNDVLLIYGNAKEGIYHIASKRGSNVLFHVLDALADGKILNLCRETKRCIFKKTDLPQFFP